MPIDQARERKWREGREKYGPEFVGDPIEEFDAEMLDAMNYLDTMDEQGVGIPGLHDELYQICSEVRAHFRRVRK